jgi:hypothetical protein
MIRRSFLKAAAALLAAPLAAFGRRGEYVHPAYGRYAYHRADRTVQTYAPFPGLPETILWPVEAGVTVQFERVRLFYVAYNPSQDLIDRLNFMRPRQLVGLGFAGDAADEVRVEERVSVVEESKGRPSRVAGRFVKFRLASVEYLGGGRKQYTETGAPQS